MVSLSVYTKYAGRSQPSGVVLAAILFHSSLYHAGCCFCLKKGMVRNIEENTKLYKYLERRKSHLRHQWFAAPVPDYLYTDGVVRGVHVPRYFICGAAAPFHDWRCISQILWYPCCTDLVYEPENLWREEALRILKIQYQLSSATESNLCRKDRQVENQNTKYSDYSS